MLKTETTGKAKGLLLSGSMLPRGGLAVLSGVLLALSFPRFDLGPLAFGALVPLLVGLDGAPLLQGTYLGIIAGLVFYLMSIPWLVHTMGAYGSLPLPLSILLPLACPSTSHCTSACLHPGSHAYLPGEVSAISWGQPPSG